MLSSNSRPPIASNTRAGKIEEARPVSDNPAIRIGHGQFPIPRTGVATLEIDWERRGFDGGCGDGRETQERGRHVLEI
jgi:hypothetical protein